jgi:hypothetical protein
MNLINCPKRKLEWKFCVPHYVVYPSHSSSFSRTNVNYLCSAAAPVRAQVRSCQICGGQSGTGVGLLRVLRFSLPILIPPTAPHSSSIIQGWCNRPVCGRRTKWTQSHPKLFMLPILIIQNEVAVLFHSLFL